MNKVAVIAWSSDYILYSQGDRDRKAQELRQSRRRDTVLALLDPEYNPPSLFYSCQSGSSGQLPRTTISALGTSSHEIAWTDRPT